MSNPAKPSGRYRSGTYKPAHPEKYIGDKSKIIFRSSWEYQLCVFLDQNPKVISWGLEPMAIPYYSSVDKKTRRYFVDFVANIQGKEGGPIRKIMIEVKPNKEKTLPNPPRRKTAKSRKNYETAVLTYHRNQDKWEAAREFATKHSMFFFVFDEYDLGIKRRKR